MLNGFCIMVRAWVGKNYSTATQIPMSLNFLHVLAPLLGKNRLLAYLGFGLQVPS